jgi:DNA-binding transcriptional LysR family regulator
VLPVALGFLAENPEITLRLFLADRQVNMVEEHVDVAVRIGHLEDSGLIATRVGAVRRVICASPAYLARRGTPRTPADLKDHDGITLRGFPIAPEWRYRKDGAAFVVEPKTRLAINATDAAIDAALADLGIIRVLSYQVADELKSGALQAVLEEFAPEPLPVSLVYPDGSHLPPKVRTFLDWTIPKLRARLADPGSIQARRAARD